MKKILMSAVVASLALTSCTYYGNDVLHHKTAVTQNVNIAPVFADLIISESKISYEYHHDSYGDETNAKECAVYDALKKHGNADVLVAPQFDVEILNGVQKVTVTGYPAKYKNFRNASVANVEEEERSQETNRDVSKKSPSRLPFGNKAKSSDVARKSSITTIAKTGDSSLFVAAFKQEDNLVVVETIKPADEGKVQSNSQETIKESTPSTKSNIAVKLSADAEKVLTKKAKSGNVRAQYELGYYYFQLSKQDPDNFTYDHYAKKWLKKAAEQGHKDAQYELGCYYWNQRQYPGYGKITKDWLKKAAEQGHKEAADLLKNL